MQRHKRINLASISANPNERNDFRLFDYKSKNNKPNGSNDIGCFWKEVKTKRQNYKSKVQVRNIVLKRDF